MGNLLYSITYIKNEVPSWYASLRGVLGEIGNVTSDPHSHSTPLCVIGAVDGARSRNTQFGKLVLYQLSYYGMLVTLPGFEPRLTDRKSVVLPLDDRAIW